MLIEPSVAPPVGWLRARFTVTELAVWDGLGRIVTLKVLSVSSRLEGQGAGGRCVILAGDGRAVAGGVSSQRRWRSGCRHAPRRSRAAPAVASTEMVDVRNCTLTGSAETALENSEVSPVDMFVAVAVTQMFAGRLLDGVNEMGVLPLASVVTVVEPIDVCPWP